MSSEKLYKANRKYFEKSFPGVISYIDSAGQPLSRIVWEGDEAVDIDLGNGRLYKKPASEYAREQLDAYFDGPERVVLNSPEGVNLRSTYSIQMLNFLLNEVSGVRKLEMLGQSEENIGFLLIIGVGLGLHVEQLIKRIKPRTAIIVEPIAEFLRHSMHAVDWAGLARWGKKNDVELVFTTASAPDPINRGIIGSIQKSGRFRMDGSYIYTHYSTFVTNEVRNKVKEAAPYLLVVKGWFEDEVDMILNSAGNYLQNTFHLVDADPLPQRREPVFIVASGPSLDRTIEVVKKWQDHAVIFSSGSSLQALLHHGIVPDYHVELENVPAVVDMLGHILDLNKERFPDKRFTGIRLIASATVNAAVPPMFEESYLFIRDTVSSSMTFARDYRQIFYAGPNVSNTSGSLAAVLGFRDFYLFGCDCGWRSANQHHSTATAYYTSDKFKSGSEDPNKESSYKYPGNFGGMINTDIIFNWNREFLESVIELYRLRAFNCSDGVLIDGAAPTAPDSVHFDTPPIDKRAIVDTIRGSCRQFEPGEFFADHDLDDYVTQCDGLDKAIAKFVRKMKKECKAADEFYDRLLEILEEWKKEFPGPARTGEGTIVGVPMVGMFFFNRIKDPVIRAEILAAYIEKFGDLMAAMGEKNRAMFEDVAERGRAVKAKRLGVPVEDLEKEAREKAAKKKKPAAKAKKKAAPRRKAASRRKPRRTASAPS